MLRVLARSTPHAVSARRFSVSCGSRHAGHAGDRFVGLYPRIADAWRVMHDWDRLLSAFDTTRTIVCSAIGRRTVRTARQRLGPRKEIPAAVEVAAERRLPAETLLLLGFDVVPPSLDRC
jgi:hypothetical protein